MGVTPSRVARAVAGREWPDVQVQRWLAPGVFGFTCAGHGGIVAIVGVADLPEAAVELAREHGQTELIVFRPGEVMYSGGSPAGLRTPIYRRESLERWARERRFPTFEVWVGEEDCDWACIVLANDGIREGGIEARYFASGLTAEDVRGCAERWSGAFVRELDRLAVAA